MNRPPFELSPINEQLSTGLFSPSSRLAARRPLVVAPGRSFGSALDFQPVPEPPLNPLFETAESALEKVRLEKAPLCFPTLSIMTIELPDSTNSTFFPTFSLLYSQDT